MDFETNRIVQLPPDGRYVVAVSGGVDSVVLLDQLAHANSRDYELVVAHFDHGIRDDSAQDSAFVSELAKKYQFAFESKREELGAGASEDLARTRRYMFLREVAIKYAAKIVTAHHADDCIETVAINLTRGTGWRGLAVLDSDIVRPLLGMTKKEIITYATDNQLVWHEDSTNVSDAYLRNRIRRKATEISDSAKREVLGLRAHQVVLKNAIDAEVRVVLGNTTMYSRYFFVSLDDMAALECLRLVTAARLTRPQLTQVQLAIKTARPGSIYQAGNGVQFSFTSRNFRVELIK